LNENKIKKRGKSHPRDINKFGDLLVTAFVVVVNLSHSTTWRHQQQSCPPCLSV